MVYMGCVVYVYVNHIFDSTVMRGWLGLPGEWMGGYRSLNSSLGV